ncbi:hypothetical protein MK805_08175 [Shimazuella sp. AN120528]|uniref:hypothetical protein n=1 Tax=Shimazuella soli TaxID=1892854 RepID=UPI001F115E8C|nr:hypothetical protein [Shimazuella soli]MCH5584949.1 hypothetical protein [Shimazuella soli]
MNREREYQEISDSINQLVGRKAVTSKKIKNVINEAKHIRKTQGTSGLLRFASALPYQFFTPKELDHIQATPQYRELSNRLIDLLVVEGVISSFEAMFLRRQV